MEQCGSGLQKDDMLKEIYIQVVECETTKKRSQIKRDWTQRTSQVKRWNDFFPRKTEESWPTIINKYCATHLQKYDIIHCS